MKKIKYITYFTLSMWISICVVSCYDDKSTLADNPIDAVVIDTTGIKLNHYIGYQEFLSISPSISVENNNDNGQLKYEWELAILTSGNNEFEIISTDKSLNEVISRPISTTPYKLRLIVTDTAHDNLQYICSWNVYVQSSFVDGLLISDTKDGATSDFSYIKNSHLTVNYNKEEKIYRQMLENANGSPYNKLMTSLTYEVYSGTNHQVWAVTDDGDCVRFNCKDFSENGNSNDESIITYKPEGLKFISFFRAYQIFFAYTTAGFYSFNNTSVNTFGWYDAVAVGYTPNSNIFASNSSKNSVYNHTVWLDETRAQFISYSGISNFGTASVGGYIANTVYDPNDLPNQTAIAAGMTDDASIASFLLKDNSTGSYAIYTLGRYQEATGTYDDDWNWTEITPEIPASARNKYIIPSEGKSLLDNAVSVFFAQRENVLYVATTTGIYAILYGSGDNAVVSTTPKYTVSGGEAITKAKLYQMGQHSNDMSTTTGTPPEITPLPWNNKAIILTTQNGDSDGKVYVIPISQPGIGTLDPSNGLSYDGFGKILDVTAIGY